MKIQHHVQLQKRTTHCARKQPALSTKIFLFFKSHPHYSLEVLFKANFWLMEISIWSAVQAWLKLGLNRASNRGLQWSEVDLEQRFQSRSPVIRSWPWTAPPIEVSSDQKLAMNSASNQGLRWKWSEYSIPTSIHIGRIELCIWTLLFHQSLHGIVVKVLDFNDKNQRLESRPRRKSFSDFLCFRSFKMHFNNVRGCHHLSLQSVCLL